MSYEVSDRGFRHYEPIATDHGHEVRVYESSAANEPHLWLDVTLTADGARAAHSGILPESATAHMNIEQALKLRDEIDEAIAGHYQLRDWMEVEPESGSSFEAVLADVAEDLGVETETLSEAFDTWLGASGIHHPDLPPDLNVACYTVYRLTKSTTAFRMTARSRERWREVALRRGANLQLAANDGGGSTLPECPPPASPPAA